MTATSSREADPDHSRTPSSHARLRIAVIGAGLGSSPHFKSLDDLSDEVEVAWVYARDAARLATTPVPGQAQRTSRLEDILEDAGVRAVMVLTPPHTHLELTRALALAGKHVLVEKPLEIDLGRATELVEVCEAAGVTLAIMLQHRMREAARSLAALVQSGELGPLVSARASVRWWRPQSYYDEPGRGTLARDGGGVLMTQAIHTLDLLLSLTGLPERITAHASTSAVHRMECEDTAAALLHYAGGAIGMVEAHHAGAGASVMGFDHGAHRQVLQDFFRAVAAGTEPAVTGRSALAVHRVIHAIMASSRSGAAVGV